MLGLGSVHRTGIEERPAGRAARVERLLVLLQRGEKETSAEIGLREVPELDPDEIRRHTMPPFVSAVD
jgi:hypothetical protein